MVLDNLADDRFFATLPLPFNQCLTIKNMEETRAEDYIRVYSKNLPSMGHDLPPIYGLVIIQRLIIKPQDI